MADGDDSGIPADPGPATFKEAVAKFRERVPMPADEYAKLTADEKRKSFTVAEVLNARLVSDVFNALAKSIEQGTPFETFKAEVGAQLAEAWGGESPGRLETMFRTNLLTAYNGGRHALITAPAVQRVRPYLRFDGIDDSAQSEICAAAMGTVLPADDPWWASHSPPLHPNCRSVLTPLSEDEALEEGIEDDPPPLEPVEGFGVPPDEKGEDWVPDMTLFPAEIREELAARLKKAG